MKNICLIGPPGCGKSTQIKMLLPYLKQQGPIFHGKVTNVVFLDESVTPYLTDIEKKWCQERMDNTREDKRSGDLADIAYDHLLFEVTKRIPEDSTIVFD
jgi:energy-coupling factor transporter ATP-binding protein EcfA2